MRKKILSIVLLLIILLTSAVSCNQRKQAPAQNAKQDEKSKGYLIFINTDSPEKKGMYSVDVEGKKKEKVYDKDPFSAAGFGEKIAFLTKESGKQYLNMINADGSSQIAIIGNSNIKEDSLSWSPDGKRIVFIAKQGTDKADEVYYVEAGKNKTPIELTSDSFPNENPKFSSDGKMIFYVKHKDNNYDIYKHDISAQNSINISNNTTNDISPEVSPDGTKILFLSDEKEKGKYNLYSMDMNGGSRAELTTKLSILKDSIKISRDSSMVAFIIISEKGNRKVQIIDMNKTTMMISNDAYMIVWSSNSKALYFATFDPKNRKIVEYDIIGKTMKDVYKIEYKPGEESMGIKFLHYADKLK